MTPPISIQVNTPAASTVAPEKNSFLQNSKVLANMAQQLGLAGSYKEESIRNPKGETRVTKTASFKGGENDGVTKNINSTQLSGGVGVRNFSTISFKMPEQSKEASTSSSSSTGVQVNVTDKGVSVKMPEQSSKDKSTSYGDVAFKIVSA